MASVQSERINNFFQSKIEKRESKGSSSRTPSKSNNLVSSTASVKQEKKEKKTKHKSKNHGKGKYETINMAIKYIKNNVNVSIRNII